VLVLLWVYKPEVVGILRRLRGVTSSPDSSDPVERLERLGKLKADGVLTEDEFDAQKKRILGGG
jgi:hypothetical protein